MNLERPARALAARPRAVLAAAALAAAGAALLLARFRIDPDLQGLFPRDDPTLRLTRHLQGDSPPARVLLVILRGGRAEALEEAVPRAVEALRASPYLVRVTATREEFAGPRVEWMRQGILDFLPAEALARLRGCLAGPGRRAELEASRRRIAEDPLSGKAVALRDPLGTRWVFDEAAEHLSRRFPARLRPGSPWLLVDEPPIAFLRALGGEDSFNVGYSQRLLTDVRARLAAALGGRPVQAELAGGYPTAAWQAGAMRRDMIVQTASSAVLVLGFLAWFTRSGRGPLAILAPVALSIFLGLGLGGALLGPLTPLVVSAAAVLLAQGIDLPVHLFSRFRSERAGREPVDAVVRAQASLGRPFVGAVGTTLAAFLMLLTSRFPGFVQFGAVLAIGLALCLAATLTIFPVLLLGLDRGARPGAGEPLLVRWASGRPRPLPALAVAAAGIASWAAALGGGLRMDLDVRNSMAPGDPGQAAFLRLEVALGVSITPVFALVDAGTPLDEIRVRLAALRARGAIVSADGPHELFPGSEARARAEAFRRETAGWVEGALAEMASMGFQPAPFRPALEELRGSIERSPPGREALARDEFAALRRGALYEDGGRTWWVLTLFPPRSLWRPEERGAFDAAARAELGSGVRLLGAFHLPDHYGRALMDDLLRVSLLTAAAVVLLSLLSVGGLKDGLLALVPATAATGFTLGAAVLLGGTINLMNMVAIPIILGIGVDGGIHYMCRLREIGRDPLAAARDVGPGVWGSAATTVLGFGSIAFSVTPGLSSMGILVSVGTSASLLATLLLLPWLCGRGAGSGRPAPGRATLRG